MLDGKVAVVTGGSSGIGAAVSLALANEGANVAVVSSSDKAKAAKVCEQAQGAPGGTRPYAADVTDASAVEGLMETVVGDFGGLDILVNAAGLYFPTPLEGGDADAVDQMISVNLKGVWQCTSAAVPRLKSRGGGNIVNISSVAAYVGLSGFSMYCATKAAIVMLTRAHACELAPHGIRVAGIAPGNTATPMNEAYRNDPANKPYLEAMKKATPSGTTFSKAEEIADAVVFMVTKGRPIHGSTLLIDEGLSAGLTL